MTKDCHNRKEKYKIDCYILHTILLAIILLLTIAIIYHYAKHRPKLKKKNIVVLQYKMKNNEFQKVCIKNRTCYNFYDTIQLQDFNPDNILIDKKSHENILIYDI